MTIITRRTATPIRQLTRGELDAREKAAVEIAREAGAVAQAAFSGPEALRVEMKGPQDFLTITDAAVETLIRSRLADLFPHDRFLGEESGGVIGNDMWVVDPIDGTANFARRIPHYCVSIAFVSEAEVRLGVIYDPAHDELYLARKNHGATKNGVPISVSATDTATAACVELGWSNRIPNADYLDVFGKILESGANVRRSASGALALAYVADGRSDAYAELHMNPWDCLAGLLLVAEAGGRVCRFLEDGGLSQGGGVLAAAPGVAALMAKATGIALA